jgi:hypothetical protein
MQLVASLNCMAKETTRVKKVFHYENTMSWKNDTLKEESGAYLGAIAVGEAYFGSIAASEVNLVVITAGVCAKGAKKVEVISLCLSYWTIMEKILLMEGMGSISRI